MQLTLRQRLPLHHLPLNSNLPLAATGQLPNTCLEGVSWWEASSRASSVLRGLPGSALNSASSLAVSASAAAAAAASPSSSRERMAAWTSLALAPPPRPEQRCACLKGFGTCQLWDCDTLHPLRPPGSAWLLSENRLSLAGHDLVSVAAASPRPPGSAWLPGPRWPWLPCPGLSSAVIITMPTRPKTRYVQR